MAEPIEYKRKGRYRVYDNGVFISQHNEEHVAKSKATYLKLKSPQNKVEIVPPSFEANVNMGMLQSIINSSVGGGDDAPTFPSTGLNPILSNFRILDDQKSRVYFDSSTNLISGSTTTGFTISNKTIT